MKVLSHPFRFNPHQPGRFAQVDTSTDEWKDQQIQAFALTHKGERPIFADFGTLDPTFGDFDENAFGSEFSSFYPTIALVDLSIVERGGATAEIVVEFE